ncbi:MAG: CHASE3 domain-containing protein [Bryobacteraceae bacterium]
MKWTAQEKFRVGFVLLLIFPLLLCVMAARTAMRLIDSADDVAHTNEIEKKLTRLFDGLKDIEVAEREFILSGDQKRLEQFKRGRADIEQQIDELRHLTRDNHRQRDSFDLLEPLIPQKFEEMEKAVRIRETEGVAAASAIILSDKNDSATDNIKTVVDRLMAEEERLLKERTGDQSRNFRRTMIVFLAMLVVNVVLVLALFMLIRRDAGERRREEERIRHLNADLERRVEQRTEALRRSNEDLQQFAYVASHDLQEPLRMVASYTELLKRRYHGKLDADADQFIDYAVDGVKRMTTLIRDLLAYSRAGETPSEKVKELNPEDTLHMVLQNLEVTIGDVGATITHDPLPPVEFDPVRLSQLFQNLLANALKYRGERAPSVHISAVTQGAETIFSIADNGIGIDAKYSEQIFGIFKRLHGREYEGTGIGLAMCKKIVERQGGRIWVESRPGEGSTFSFSIPNHRSARAAGAM